MGQQVAVTPQSGSGSAGSRAAFQREHIKTSESSSTSPSLDKHLWHTPRKNVPPPASNTIEHQNTTETSSSRADLRVAHDEFDALHFSYPALLSTNYIHI
eukprot:1142871-Pelagomonas_calceolata.AAC.7